MAGPKHTKHCTYLPERQERFCLNLVTRGMTGSGAVEAAGYGLKTDLSKRAHASRLLTKPNIKARVAELRADAAAAGRINAALVLRGYLQIATANMDDFLEKQEDGSVFVNFNKVSREQMAAVSEITTEEYTEGRGPRAREVKRVKLKLHPRTPALDSLAKHLGLFVGDRALDDIAAALGIVRMELVRPQPLPPAIEHQQLEAPEQESTGAPENE